MVLPFLSVVVMGFWVGVEVERVVSTSPWTASPTPPVGVGFWFMMDWEAVDVQTHVSANGCRCYNT